MRYQATCSGEMVFLVQTGHFIVLLENNWFWSGLDQPYLIILYRTTAPNNNQTLRLVPSATPYKHYKLAFKVSPWTFNWFKNKAKS